MAEGKKNARYISAKESRKIAKENLKITKAFEKEKKRKLSPKDKEKLIEQYTAEMREASRKLEFEKAAFLRDKIKELKTTKQVNK